MKPHLLFIISTDPRTSHRPAEAIRMAAGVSAWEKVNIRIYLRGPAVHVLSDVTDELMDENVFSSYLSALTSLEHPIYIQKGSPQLAGMGKPTLSHKEISEAQLAELAAKCTSVLCF